MQKSEVWKLVFEILNQTKQDLWSEPIAKLDILLEKQFYDIRSKQLKDEDYYQESNSTVEQVVTLQKQNEDL